MPDDLIAAAPWGEFDVANDGEARVRALDGYFVETELTDQWKQCLLRT